LQLPGELAWNDPTAIFRPNTTARYQGYQGLLYIGYHELGPLVQSRRQSVQNGFETLESTVHTGLPDSLFWLERESSIQGDAHTSTYLLEEIML